MRPPVRLADARRALSRRLDAAGAPDAGIEARMLVQSATGLDRTAMAAAPEWPLSTDEQNALEALAARRLSGEPIQHVLGHADFWSLRLKSDARALVPRSDTETIVQAALERIPGASAPLRVLDLGTGTGAILLALLSELPGAWGLGVDRSEAALSLAGENAALTGLADRAAFMQGDWGAALAGRFDLVVSNPPYIRAGEIAGLAPEVQRDPAGALDGGADGLDAYRALIPQLPGLVRPGGVAVLEIGFDQADDVAVLADACADVILETVAPDLEGRPRAVVLRVSGLCGDAPHSRGEKGLEAAASQARV